MFMNKYNMSNSNPQMAMVHIAVCYHNDAYRNLTVMSSKKASKDAVIGAPAPLEHHTAALDVPGAKGGGRGPRATHTYVSFPSLFRKLQKTYLVGDGPLAGGW
jgi:hypothetical protein